MFQKPKVYFVGCGMAKFEKPSRKNDFDHPDMAKKAVAKALSDAGVSYADIGAACVGCVCGNSTCGQQALYEVGLGECPIFNLYNCSTGATILMMAKQIIESGNSNCVLALGFEKIERLMANVGMNESPMAPQLYGNAGIKHMERYNMKPEHMTEIVNKHQMNLINNPFQPTYPFTKLQCCPTSDGSAAIVLANEDFIHKYHLEHKAIEIVALEMSTDLPLMFMERGPIKIIGYDTDGNAAESFNPSGGLISKCHPLVATDLAQCCELSWQLRDKAGLRQMSGAKLALQHNVDLDGAVMVGLYQQAPVGPIYKNYTSADSKSDEIPNPEIFKAHVLFKALEKAMQEDEDGLVERFRGIYGLRVVNGPGGAKGYWVINTKTGKGTVEWQSKVKPDVTFTISDKDVVDFISGKLSPQKAFFMGKVKIQGNMGMAMKLTDLQRRAAKKIEMIRAKL